jgi:hypothetical protein
MTLNLAYQNRVPLGWALLVALSIFLGTLILSPTATNSGEIAQLTVAEEQVIEAAGINWGYVGIAFGVAAVVLGVVILAPVAGPILAGAATVAKVATALEGLALIGGGAGGIAVGISSVRK